MRTLLTLAVMIAAGANLSAQEFVRKGAHDPRTRAMEPQMSEFYHDVPIVTPPSEGCAPSDAVILFDGSSLRAWTSADGTEAKWKIHDRVLTVDKSKGDILSKESFTDFQLHIEWRVPSDIHGSGQQRANSGIFLQDRYEIQILDSFNSETYSNGQAGSVYKQSAPLVNPMRKPGEWNTMEIIYAAPTFRENGSYRTFPTVTVLLNGVLVQNHTTILGTTEYIGFPQVEAHGAAPIRLQSHGDKSEPLDFRNIWIRRL